MGLELGLAAGHAPGWQTLRDPKKNENEFFSLKLGANDWHIVKLVVHE